MNRTDDRFGIDALWRRLLSGDSAIAPVTRFPTGNFHASTAGIVQGLTMKHVVRRFVPEEPSK